MNRVISIYLIVAVFGNKIELPVKNCSIPELFYGSWEKGIQHCGLTEKYSHPLLEYSASYERSKICIYFKCSRLSKPSFRISVS